MTSHEKSVVEQTREKSKAKPRSPVFVIAKRELASYFSSPAAYIVTGLFLIISGVLFFSVFFLQRRAELRNFFGLLPVLFSFFIPAITMRLFSEEKNSGSIETLLTLPVTEPTVVFGKFLAGLVSAVAMICPTIFYVITAYIFGTPDAEPVVGGYIGAIFLCAAFSSIGVFASCLTKNQIIAFFVAFIICISLTMIDSFLVFLPSVIVGFFSAISANAHFSSISRGIIDSRDLIYFISITLIFILLSIMHEDSERS